MGRHLLALTPISNGSKDLRLDPGPQTVRLDAIRQRIEDTRPLNAPHVVALAESIAVLGLLEPLVIDTRGNLLAGGHRLAALQLLAFDDDNQRAGDFRQRINTSAFSQKAISAGGPGQYQKLIDRVYSLRINSSLRRPTQMIPVLVVDVSGKHDGDKRKLAVEIAENNVRRPYSAPEIVALAARLKSAGYTVRKGRPKAGEVTMIGILEAAVGRSKRTIERIISKQPANKKSAWHNARLGFIRAAHRLQAEGKGQRSNVDRKLLALATKILACDDGAE